MSISFFLTYFFFLCFQIKNRYCFVQSKSYNIWIYVLLLYICFLFHSYRANFILSQNLTIASNLFFSPRLKHILLEVNLCWMVRYVIFWIVSFTSVDWLASRWEFVYASLFCFLNFSIYLRLFHRFIFDRDFSSQRYI